MGRLAGADPGGEAGGDADRARGAAAGWHHPDVAPQQAALAADELAAWRGGAPVAPFDAFARLVRCARPASVLDVGCGAGYYADVLRDVCPGATYAGCDYSAPMLAAARGRYPGLPFDLADQRDLPYDDGAVELVVNGSCLLHLADLADWEEALAEAARVASRWVLLHRVPVRMGDYAAEGVHRVRKGFYGVEIRETWIPWPDLEARCAAVGLHPPATVERWNEGADPEQASLLLQVAS